MAIADPARLYTALLNTGLQQKDPALYQVIHDLIAQVINLAANQSSVNSSSSTPATVDQSVIMARIILDN